MKSLNERLDTKFYTYSQNNSGGSFTGPAHYVIIEAFNKDAAHDIAEQHGVYFNGIEDGHDCSCCGDRWSRWSDENEVPSIYGEPVETTEESRLAQADGVTHALIVYLNGTTKEI